jgi:transposase
MSKKRKRRRFTSEQKARILSEHLFEKKPISEVCEAHELQPSVVYDWQRHAQANLAQALEGPQNRASSRERELEARVAQLEAKLAKKTGVIAEIAEELVTLKKSSGEP